MRSDGLGDTTRGDREQIGCGANRDAVIGDAQRLRPGAADQVEGDLHLSIAPEVAFPADNRRPLQQVGGAEGDQVSRMSTLPANTNTPAARSVSIGGRVSPPAP